MNTREPPVITDDQFLEWCGSHHVKGCGTTRMMPLHVDVKTHESTHGEDDRPVSKCEDCRARAQRDFDVAWYRGREVRIAKR